MHFRSRSVEVHLPTLALALAVVAATPRYAMADESGVSFWTLGQYGSLAAVPGEPGFGFATTYYHTSVGASGNVGRSVEFRIGQFNPTLSRNLAARLNAKLDLIFLSPSYTFTAPVLGGQFALGLTGILGRASTSAQANLTATLASFSATRSAFSSDSLTNAGDLYPQATLKWNQGLHNFMVYAMGDIPVGAYQSARLSNLGIGHGAIDAGGGYTYLDQENGHELSAVSGFTYNFMNPSTHYQSGVDFHFDWGASQFLSKQFSVGAVGYLYQQVGCDSGSGDKVGCFQSRVAAIGPQLSYIFPVGDLQGYLNLRGYKEFAAKNRADGWSVWLTFAISMGAPTVPQTEPHRK